jgi:hypothetical protein
MPEPRPALSEFYKPPTYDVVLVVRFAGNTADIVEVTTATPQGVSPGQLWAAARALERAGDKMAVVAEAQAERHAQMHQIITAKDLPPDDGRPGMPRG